MFQDSKVEQKYAPVPRVQQVCQHTLCHKSADGHMQGTWVEVRVESITYVACNICGAKFGTVANANDEAVRQAYLEQQRRLACPGCGESPFLG